MVGRIVGSNPLNNQSKMWERVSWQVSRNFCMLHLNGALNHHYMTGLLSLVGRRTYTLNAHTVQATRLWKEGAENWKAELWKW